MTGRPSLLSIFGVPLAICVLGVIGLISALTGDGWRDAISWLALGAPVAAIAWARKFRKS